MFVIFDLSQRPDIAEAMLKVHQMKEESFGMNIDEEMQWQEFRGECLEFMQNKHDNTIKNWLNKIGYTGTVGYYFNIVKNTLEIYTKHPGVLIGKSGCNIKNLKNMVCEEYGSTMQVKIIEVRGGFVNGQQAD